MIFRYRMVKGGYLSDRLAIVIAEGLVAKFMAHEVDVKSHITPDMKSHIHDINPNDYSDPDVKAQILKAQKLYNGLRCVDEAELQNMTYNAFESLTYPITGLDVIFARRHAGL